MRGIEALIAGLRGPGRRGQVVRVKARQGGYVWHCLVLLVGEDSLVVRTEEAVFDQMVHDGVFVIDGRWTPYRKDFHESRHPDPFASVVPREHGHDHDPAGR